MPRHTAFVLALGLALAGCGDPPGAERAAGLSGRWTGAAAAGKSELVLEDRGDTLVMRAEGDEAVGRRTGDGRFEGETSSPQGTLRFVLERRGAQLVARYTWITPDGQAQQVPEVIYSRADTPSASGSASPSSASRPAELVGHWRFTRVMTSAEFSLVTDTHIVLRADGTCSTWTKHQDGSGDPEEQGEWRAEGGHLQMRPPGDGSWRDAGQFTADGERLRLVLPSGDRQIFERL